MTLANFAKKLHYADYQVCWICPLPLERIAAEAMLDETHESLDNDGNDTNVYTLGKIGKHNVAIAGLETGNSVPTAIAAQHMRYTFKNMRVLLLVGIGGGVPNKSEDIRLGDIVVSYPDGTYGGVIQIDAGKNVPRSLNQDGFEYKGSLNQPPEQALKVVRILQGRHQDLLEAAKTPEYVNILLEAIRERPHAKYPGVTEDQSFKFTYDHIAGKSTCEGCDTRQLVYREARLDTKPRVHLGLIASSNAVRKDGHTRERLSKIFNILCFEMEAAGVMNSFPCLVIRGISDYADSHKNDKWQQYAALAAAAYAKEWLMTFPEIRNSTSDQLEPGPGDTTDEECLALSKLAKWRVTFTDEKGVERCDNVFDRLSKHNPERALAYAARDKCENTTSWIRPYVESWLSRPEQSCLWLHGIVGSGKTVLASEVVHFLKTRKNPAIPVIHFFFDPRDYRGTSALFVLESLTKQLVAFLDRKYGIPDGVRKAIKEMYSPRNDNLYTSEQAAILSGQRVKYHQEVHPSISEITDRVILPLVAVAPGLALVIDGVDRCPATPQERYGLLKTLRRVTESGARVFISGRREAALTELIPSATELEISKTQQEVRDSISTYIRTEIKSRMEYQRITNELSTEETIHTILLQKADAMFLWVKLLLDDIWYECQDIAAGPDSDKIITQCLASLPESLKETFQKCLKRNEPEDQKIGKQILRYVCGAAFPLGMKELQDALACNPSTGKLDLPRLKQEAILRCGAGLVSFDKDDGLVLPAHHSIRQWISGEPDKPPPRWPNDTRELDIGGLCVKHCEAYPPDWQLMPTRAQVDLSLPGRILATHLPTLGLDWFDRVYSFCRPTASPSETFPMPKPSYSGHPNLHFLAYARMYWLQNTRFLPSYSPIRERWQRLAFNDYRSMRFPWSTEDNATPSQVSHLVTLFGWSIVQDHPALLSVFLSSRNVLPNDMGIDIYNDPLPHHGNHPPLIVAANAGQNRSVFSLLQSPYVDPDQRDKERCGVFHILARRGVSEAFTENWLSANRIVKASQQLDGRGRSPLFYAAEKGHSDIVRSLLEYGSSATEEEGGGETAIDAAAVNGHSTALKIMIEHTRMNHATRNLGELYLRWGALPLAAQGGHLEAVDVLLNAGANVDARTGRARDWTALQTAAEEGHLSVVEKLLDAGADVNAEAGRSRGRTALQAAAGCGNIAMVERLLAANADVNARAVTSHGRTALQAAAERGHTTIVERLLSVGADVNAAAAEYGGSTALYAAADRGHLEIVEQLLSAGADIDTEVNFQVNTDIKADINGVAGPYPGWTALEAALKRGHLTVVEKLVTAGARRPKDRQPRRKRQFM